VWNAWFARTWNLKHVKGTPQSSRFYKDATLSTFVSRYRVETSDSIASIALKSQRRVSLLKQINNLVSDSSLHCRKEIYIPVSKPEHLHGAHVRIHYCKFSLREYCFVISADDTWDVSPTLEPGRCRPDSKKQEENLVSLMSRSLKIDECSAKYYLEVSDYDLKEAMSNYRIDDEWEKTQQRASRRPKDKLHNGIFCCYKN